MPAYAIRRSRVRSIIFAVVLCAAALLAPLELQVGARGTIINPSTSSDPARYLDVNGFRFDPLADPLQLPDELRYAVLPQDGSSFYILQLHPPITQATRAQLVSAGLSLLGYVNSNAFVVKADPATIARAHDLPQVRWVGPFEPAFKLSPRLSQDETEAPVPTDITVETMGTPSLAASTSLRGTATGSFGRSGVDSLATSRIRVTLLSFEKSGVLRVAAAAAALGATDILWSTSSSGVVRAEIGRDALIPLARNADVMWIDREVRPHVFNDIARWVIQSGNGTTFATPVHDHGIFGTGQVVTVGDTGLDYQHDAFEDPAHSVPGPDHRKVTDYYVPSDARGDATDNGINHGTHVAGTVAGDDGTWHIYDGDPAGTNGTAGPHDGQAFDATLQVQDLSTDGAVINPPSDLHDMYLAALDRNSSVHTNSWGSCCSDYIAEAAQTDDFVWGHPDFIVLYAAGNSGGPSTINPYAVAKNVIAVGATQNGASRNDIAYFSSRGPTADGRLKPDVMAPGWFIWSAHGCDPGSVCDDYKQLSGTSMATPTAAGAVALLRQYYMDGWYPTGTKQAPDAFVPSAALVKATLINGATEMTGTGAYDNGENRYPNFNQGWGRILLDDALFFQGDARTLWVDDHRAGIDTGGSVTYQLAIADASMPVEVTLVWSDVAGVPMSSPNLVNDLDLIVQGPDGTTYAGNQYAGYNPGESERNASGSDHLNNIEAVLVRSGVQSGIWTIQVSGYNVPAGPQPYAIVVTGGITRQKGFIQMDQSRYQSSATVQVDVVDAGLDVDPGAPDTASVSMSSTTEPTPESLTLTETGPSTAAFRGSILLVRSAIPLPDGRLQVVNGDTITAEYFDADDGLGGSGPVDDYAVVDDTPPVITNVGTQTVRFFRATVVWTTDESSDSVVYWGTGTPTAPQSDAHRVTNHAIVIAGLAASTTYYYYVLSTDEAGNTARADNGGAFYSFRTPSKPPDSPPDAEWPQFHHDRERGGVGSSAYAMPLTARWNTTVGGSRIHWSNPVIDNHTVFYTEREGTVTALDLGTGVVRWQAYLGDFGYVHGTPAVDSGTVYVAMVTGGGTAVTLFALDETTGEVRWRHASPAPSANAFTTPAVDGTSVYWYDYSGKTLHATDVTNGADRWTFAMPDRGFQGPTVWAGIVYVTDGVGDIIAIDAPTGTEFWRTSVGSTITSAPTLAGGVLYVGDYTGAMYAINPLNGSRIWKTPLIGKAVDLSSPVVAEGLVFVGVFATETGAGRMCALDAATGAVVWRSFMVKGPVAASVAYDNGTVFVAAWDGMLYARKASSGAPLQSLLVSPAGSTSSVAIGDGYLVVGDESGKMSAFGFVGAGTVGRITVSPPIADVALTGSVALAAEAYDAFDNAVGAVTFSWSSLGGLGTLTPATESGDRAVYTAGTVSGTDTVSATNGSVSGLATIRIAPGGLSRIEVSPAIGTVPAGGSRSFGAIGKDANGNAVPLSTVVWSTTGGLGTIDSSGLFTAGGALGSGSVTATSGGISGSASVQVVVGPLASLAVSPATIDAEVSSTLVLDAIPADAYGNQIPIVPVSWTTTIGDVTPIDADGMHALFRAPISAGTGTITVSSGAVSTPMSVRIVSGTMERILVIPSTIQVRLGSTVELQALALDRYGNEIGNVTFAWSTTIGALQVSSDGRSASLSGGDHTGSGTLTVSSGTKSATVGVTVVEAGFPPEKILGMPTAFLLFVITLLLAVAAIVLSRKNRRLARRLEEAKAPPTEALVTQPVDEELEEPLEEYPL